MSYYEFKYVVPYMMNISWESSREGRKMFDRHIKPQLRDAMKAYKDVVWKLQECQWDDYYFDISYFGVDGHMPCHRNKNWWKRHKPRKNIMQKWMKRR